MKKIEISLQAYLMFCECNPKYAAKSVAIERCDQNGCYLKMDKSRQRCFKVCFRA